MFLFFKQKFLFSWSVSDDLIFSEQKSTTFAATEHFCRNQIYYYYQLQFANRYQNDLQEYCYSCQTILNKLIFVF